MTKKIKTTDFYKRKRDDIRRRKRELTSNAGGMTSDEVKVEKKRLKEEYRGLKRSEKQQVQKDIEDALEMEIEIELLAESMIESDKQEFINDVCSGLITEDNEEEE